MALCTYFKRLGIHEELAQVKMKAERVYRCMVYRFNVLVGVGVFMWLLYVFPTVEAK